MKLSPGGATPLAALARRTGGVGPPPEWEGCEDVVLCVMAGLHTLKSS